MQRRKREIRIIKRGSSNNILLPQTAIKKGEARAKDRMEPLVRVISGWVKEFKARDRPNPKSGFQALFKEA